MVKSTSGPPSDRTTPPLPLSSGRPREWGVPAGRPLHDVRAWSLRGAWPDVAIANPEGCAMRNAMDFPPIDCWHDARLSMLNVVRGPTQLLIFYVFASTQFNISLRPGL